MLLLYEKGIIERLKYLTPKELISFSLFEGEEDSYIDDIDSYIFYLECSEDDIPFISPFTFRYKCNVIDFEHLWCSRNSGFIPVKLIDKLFFNTYVHGDIIRTLKLGSLIELAEYRYKERHAALYNDLKKKYSHLFDDNYLHIIAKYFPPKFQIKNYI